MTDERYKLLMEDDTVPLSEAEIAAGWHFCIEWDGLLIGPEWGELDCCRCLDPQHPAYKTNPFLKGKSL